MNVIRHKTAAEFLDRAGVWLEQAEVENNLILGIAAYFASCVDELKTQPYFLTVEDEGTIMGAALMSPPRQLLTTAMPDDAVIELADYCCPYRRPCPAWLGALPKPSCSPIIGPAALDKPAELRGRIDSTFAPPFCNWPIHQADCDPQRRRTRPCFPSGACNSAWMRESRMKLFSFKTRLPHKIAAASLFVWETDTVVSMAGFERERPRGVAISWVFTPLRLRGRGYATSCVAALTQRMFDSGRRFCCLYADLANPTSNNIYRTIGYRAVCDVDHWVFE